MSIFSFLNKAKPRREFGNSDPTTALESDRPIEADLGYRRLEERQVLSASFLFNGTDLILNDFDMGQDLTIDQGSFDVGGGLEDVYVFQVEGVGWMDLGGIATRTISTSRPMGWR